MVIDIFNDRNIITIVIEISNGLVSEWIDFNKNN